MKTYEFGNYLPIQIRRYIKLAFVTGIVYLFFKGALSFCFPDNLLGMGLDLIGLLFVVIYIFSFLLFLSRRKKLDEIRRNLIIKGFAVNLLVVLGVILL